MNKTNGIVIALLIVLIGLVGYGVFSGPRTINNIITPGNQIIPEPQLNNSIEPTTGLVYPNGFSLVYSDGRQGPLIVKFTKSNTEYVEIVAKLENDPSCEKFYQQENFGFCVKGYQGEATSDELANIFINLNK